MSGLNALRGYQRKGINEIKKSWESNNSPMVVVATGGGKTTMISHLLSESISASDRAIIIAHTEEIVTQIYNTVKPHYGNATGIVMGDTNESDSKIIVATRQSLTSRRLAHILQFGEIGFIIIDEAHHATADNTYGNIVNTIKNGRDSKLVGFTATPSEQTTLFDDIVFSWTISDGVKGGYLVPAHQIKVMTSELDIFGERMISVLRSKDWIDLTLHAYKTHILSSNRPCLAFFPSVKMSYQFTKSLLRHGIKAAHIDGCTAKDERENILSSYKNGNIQIVCNMEVLTEGFDAPNTSAILLARPTRSKTLLTQILGRGLRTAPFKTDCLVVNLLTEDLCPFTLNDILGY